MSYEKIYCYYRTNQFVPAMELLEQVKSTNKDSSLLYLEAQILYSQGQFKQSVQVYESLLKTLDKKDVLYDEIQVNLLAAKAGLLFSTNEQDTSAVKESSEDLYEVAYNTASVYLARGEISKAQEQLQLAQKQCMEKSNHMSEEEQEEELAVIATQLGYTYQLQGRTTEAIKIYHSVLNSKDVSVVTVASNNIVSVEQTKDLDEVAKTLKLATSKEVDAKLKGYQKRVILMNESLLHLYSKKVSSATFHQHKASKAIEELKKYAERRPSSLAIHFATIQLQLLESQHAAALQTLQHYLAAAQKQDQYRPALVALLVWLYQQTGQSELAMETLDKAASVWKTDAAFTTTHTPTSIIKQTAAFKLKASRFEEAVADYEQLVKEDPTDAQAVAGLIAAYAQVDPAKAEQYGNALPEIALNHLDIDTLEKVVPGVKRGYVKKDPNSVHVKKPKEKKKRTPLLPKNMDPNVQPDPERWLPKQERSTFRMKGKNKKAANKGPQGAAVEGGGIGGTGSANISGVKKSNSTEQPAAAAVVESVPKPTTVSTNKSSSKKKKGKGKSKW
ncbi:hypothetical protein RO3G_12312 [Rhizopus delemar RA 99-880]|uniref:Signal recognition particle subunit SRP72 n=1 Tax=Rhizopus delemar (strain RA 99-880 / ATCC MYA-4621 / FGSC 9543 / NRRL 43880) TaxID=246409 RepID=I1CGM1_RHIO9|nr:hypothetical protein RO3G_12312 [Rhizopus delemar RA 99-880]|eukprot:EIE87601.1 hypothetical protein RO3G_12312 [Rhizopus delemar RA 99-880]